eukprot:CCRYP_019865-RA/>CCRYP_019865-RA protein AED:0.38 eAED:0.57 QI:0/0/0/1/1/1/2/0/159
MPTKKKKGKKKKACATDTAIAHGCGTETEPSTSVSFWTVSQECTYYSNLGCHIANIARYSNITRTKSVTGKKSSKNTSVLTCSQYSEMYQAAMQCHPWLLGIERFDPSEYHPEDLDRIPEIGLDDGLVEDEDEDEWEDTDIVEEGDAGTLHRHTRGTGL